MRGAPILTGTVHIQISNETQLLLQLTKYLML
jgi:hypothetical protein